jgi:S-adenosylmethionine:tRNA ribosyltransferase-isomerase
VRDEVRLMVASPRRPLVHARFLDLPRHLRPGDLLVVNASATLPAAVAARREDGSAVSLHLSTPDPADAARWVVELRRGAEPFSGAAEGDRLPLPGGAGAGQGQHQRPPVPPHERPQAAHPAARLGRRDQRDRHGARLVIRARLPVRKDRLTRRRP